MGVYRDSDNNEVRYCFNSPLSGPFCHVHGEGDEKREEVEICLIDESFYGDNFDDAFEQALDFVTDSLVELRWAYENRHKLERWDWNRGVVDTDTSVALPEDI